MKHHLSICLTAAIAALITACGGSPSANLPPQARASAQSDHAMLAFAQCMRTHGVSMRDPFHRPGHSGLSLDMPEGVTATPAYTSCVHYLARIIAMKQAGARALAAQERLPLIHYARCMRAHGVPMLDPNPDGSLSLGNVPGMSTGVGRDTPQFHSADGTCRRVLPPGVHDDGTGP